MAFLDFLLLCSVMWIIFNSRTIGFQTFEESRLANTPLCPDPSPVANAYRFSVPDGVRYTCVLGYQMTSGDNFLTCQSNGSWGEHPPTCELTCGQPLTSPGANMTGFTTDSAGVRFAMYQCLPQINASFTLFLLLPCSKDTGYWMTPTTNCIYQKGFHGNLSSANNNQTYGNSTASDPSFVVTANSSRKDDLEMNCIHLALEGGNGSKFTQIEVPVSNITRLFEFVSIELSLETIDTDINCIEGSQILTSMVYGISYTGYVNMSASGYPCQPWQDVTPNNHTYNDLNSTSYPDASFADVKNYCRNPQKSGSYKTRPWCFTMNSSVVWEYCSIRECSRLTTAVSVTSDNTTDQLCGQVSFYRSNAINKLSIKCLTSPTSPYGTRLKIVVNSTLARYLYVCDIVGYGVDYQSSCGEPHHQRGWNLTTTLSYQEGAEAEYVCADGYHYIQGDGKIKCLGTRVWSSATLVCSDEVNHAVTNRTTALTLQDNDDSTCSTTSSSDVYLDYTVEVRQVTVTFAGVHPNNVTVTAYIKNNLTRACRTVNETKYGFLFTCTAYPVTSHLLLTYDPDVNTSICEVKVFGRVFTGALECRQTDSGVEYKGHQNISSQGYECSPWAVINKTEFANYEFPDGNINDVMNYCRNPILKSTNQPLFSYRPICYYRIPAKSLTGYDYCDLFSCERGCRVSKEGQEYVGKLEQAIGNGATSTPCVVWNTGLSLFKWKFDFSDIGSPSTKYCRNPGKSQERPWCYTNTTSLTYAYCEIPLCPTVDNTSLIKLDLNQTSDLALLRTTVDKFRECLLTEFNQASYSQPIYDTIVNQLCYNNPGKHRDLLCHYRGVPPGQVDYGDNALWTRVSIVCPQYPLTTTTAITTVTSSSAQTQMTTGAITTKQTTTQTMTTINNANQNMCPMTCNVRCLPTNFTIEIKVYKEQIRHELLVSTSTLSKTIRMKISASDSRPSAKVTAGFAIAVVVVIIVCLISGGANGQPKVEEEHTVGEEGQSTNNV